MSSRDVSLQSFFLSIYRFYEASQKTWTNSFQLLHAVHKRQAVTFAIQWKTWTIITLSKCQALLGFTANSWDFTFKHLVVALVLVTKNSGHETLYLPHILLLGTVQVPAEQTSLYITNITSWKLQQPQLSQLLCSNQTPLIKRWTQEETLWCEKPCTIIIRIFAKVSGIK